MSRTMYKILALFAGIAACFGLALGSVGTASASVVDTHYSEFLSGYVVEGNGLQPYSDIRAHPENLPNLSGEVSADSVADGVAMGQNLSTGGQVYGLAAVWDDTIHSTCDSNQWAVEDGSEPAMTTSPQPVPVPDLRPVIAFGADICLNPGQGEWLELYHSTHFRTISVIVGPSESNDNVLDLFHNVAQDFRAPAVGLTTSMGQASTITQGTLADFAGEGIGLTLIESNKVGATQKRVTFSNQNLGVYVGTENGGAPSASNLITLQPSGFGSGSSFSITAPTLP
jgi:hypothetical protein